MHIYTEIDTCTSTYMKGDRMHTCNFLAWHIYMYLHVCTHKHTSTCMYVYMHIHTCVHTQTDICTHKHLQECTQRHIHVQRHIYTYLYAHPCTIRYRHMNLHVSAHRHIGEHAYTERQCTFVHRQTHVCIHMYIKADLCTHTHTYSPLRLALGLYSCD